MALDRTHHALNGESEAEYQVRQQNIRAEERAERAAEITAKVMLAESYLMELLTYALHGVHQAELKAARNALIDSMVDDT